MLPNGAGRRKGKGGDSTPLKAEQAARRLRAAWPVKPGKPHQIGSGTQFLNCPTVVPGGAMPEQTGFP